MNKQRAGGLDVSQVQAGVDWITWVIPTGQENRRGVALVDLLLQEQAVGGVKVRPLRMEGYIGQQGDGCALGYRKDSALIRLSGSLAASHWSALASSGGHPTRVDVQTSIWLNRPDSKFGLRVWQLSATKTHPLRGRPPKRTCCRDNRGLWLGTVGTRTSRSYLRVYDKGVESGCAPPGQCWRIELEAKQNLATSLCKEALNARDHTRWCLGAVQRACDGVASRWPLTRDDEVSAIAPPENTMPASIESAAKWLALQVRPTTERLVAALGTQRVLELLGLDAYAESFVTQRNRGKDTWPITNQSN